MVIWLRHLLANCGLFGIGTVCVRTVTQEEKLAQKLT